MLKRNAPEFSKPHPVTGEIRALCYGYLYGGDRRQEVDETYRQDIQCTVIAKTYNSDGSFSSRLTGSRLA